MINALRISFVGCYVQFMVFFAEYIFAAVLGLYMDEKAQSLPNSDEVLICSSDTTSEEVLTTSLSQKYN